MSHDPLCMSCDLSKCKKKGLPIADFVKYISLWILERYMAVFCRKFSIPSVRVNGNAPTGSLPFTVASQQEGPPPSPEFKPGGHLCQVWTSSPCLCVWVPFGTVFWLNFQSVTRICSSVTHGWPPTAPPRRVGQERRTYFVEHSMTAMRELRLYSEMTKMSRLRPSFGKF